MSKTVDQRVVEILFDNKQFERNAKATIETLNKLKEAMGFTKSTEALRGLGEATKSVKLDGIASGIEMLEKRFSTLGIVGMRVIENLTDSIMNTLGKGIDYITNSIVSGGVRRAMNIENAHFQLQALLKDETKVQAVMADAMESVDGTAYAYDEAAKAASQFSASGVQAGEDMLGALKGITGVAAMTNSSFEDISRIFTTVAGNGRLMGDQLLQLSGRGLNAASTLVDYFKEVQHQAGITEADVRQMVSKGQISFKDFSDAMTWAFGDSAKRANETFTGALSNMKSALARIGAGFISPLVEQNSEMVKLFNALRIQINNVKSSLVFDEQASAISGLSKVTGMASDELKEMFNTVKANGSVTISDLDRLYRNGANAVDALTRYIKGVKDGTIRATYSTKAALDSMTEGIEINRSEVRQLVRDGKIDINIFQSAMEEFYGDQKKLSKQFTDFFLDNIKMLTNAINAADLSKPMEAFNIVVEAVKNTLKGLWSILKPVGAAFSEVFMIFSGDDLVRFASSIASVTEKFTLSEKSSKNLHDAFKGLFDVIKILADVFLSLLRTIAPITQPITALASKFLELAGGIGRALSKFSEWIKASPSITKVYESIKNAIASISSTLAGMISKIGGVTDSVKGMSPIQKFIDSIGNSFKNLGKSMNGASTAFNPFKKVLEFLLAYVKKTGPAAVELTKKFNESITMIFRNISEYIKKVDIHSLFDIFNAGVFSSILLAAQRFIQALIDMTKRTPPIIGNIRAVIGNINQVLVQVKNTLVAYQSQLKSNVLKNIAIAVAILTAALWVLSKIDASKMAASLGAITVTIGELFGVMVGFSKLINTSMSNMFNLSVGLIGFSTAISILAGALKKIGDIDPERLLGALGAITAMITELTGVAIILSKYGGKISTGAISIIAFSEAINILASAVRKLGELNTDSLIKGLTSVGVLMGELVAFMIGAKFGKIKATQALGIIMLSVALLILEKAVKGFGSLNVDVLVKGLASVGAILTEIGAFSVLAGNAKHIISTSLSVVILAQALRMLEEPMTVFGNMSWEQIGKGLLAMGGALTELVLAFRLIPKNSLSVGIALKTVGLALANIVEAVRKMGSMSWEEIGRGLVSLGGSLTIMALGLNAMKGTLGASAAMLVLSGALAIFAPTLKSLGSLSWKQVAGGLITLAAAFAVVAAGAHFITPLIPQIFALASAMLALSAAAALVGVAVLAFGAGLTALSVSGVAGAAALVEISRVLIDGFLDALINNGQKYVEVVRAMINMVCDVIIESVPAVLKVVLALIKAVLTGLREDLPVIINLFMGLTIDIINGLAEHMPDFIQALANLFKQIFSGVANVLNGIDFKVLLQGLIGVGILSAIMFAMAALSAIAPAAMIGILALGVAITEFIAVIAAIGGLAQLPGLKWLIGEGGELLKGVGEAIGDFIGGIVSGVVGGLSRQLPELGTNLSLFMDNIMPFLVGMETVSAGTLAKAGFLSAIMLMFTADELLVGITNFITGGHSLSDMGSNLSDFMRNAEYFFNALTDVKPSVVDSAKSIADMILKLTASELLQGISRIFGLSGSLSDFGEELKKFGPSIKEFADVVKEVNPAAVEGAAAAAKIMAECAKNLPGTEGLAQKIFGEKSLAAFGEELKKFGPSIKEFADVVKEVNPAAVEGAAAAAKIMAEMAKELPPQEGLIQKIFGEKSLAAFGEELKKFGPSIKEFADVVKEVNPAAVEGAATVTKVMSTLANDLPETGGIISWFKGDNNIATFGQNLSDFGKKFLEFYNSISLIDPTRMSGVIEQFYGLVDLANAVDTVDTSSLSGFVKNLTVMGENGVHSFLNAFTKAKQKASASVSAFIDSIVKYLNSGEKTISKAATSAGNSIAASLKSGIDSKSPSAITTVKNLTTNIVNTMKKGLPSNVFNKIGQDIIQAFITGINAKKALTLSTISNLCASVIQQMRTSLPTNTFNTIGQNMIQAFITGVNAKKPLALSTIANLCTAIIQQMRTSLASSTINTIGQSAIQALINGFNAKKAAAISAITTICNAIVSEFKKKLETKQFTKMGEDIIKAITSGMNGQKSDILDAVKKLCKAINDAFKNNLSKSAFKEIGADAAEGLAKGIESKIDDIAEAAIKAAREAVKEARKELREKSPSKVTYEIGEFFSIGLANGIVDRIKDVEKAGVKVADGAIDPMQNAVKTIMETINDGTFDSISNITITPVVDMTNIRKGAEETASLFNRSLLLSTTYDKVQEAANSFERRREETERSKEQEKVQPIVQNFDFNQYNSSPKALSRSEIYRQTSNQFAAFRRAVNRA